MKQLSKEEKSEKSNNNYTVYAHINKINGKMYIGITKLNPDDRWRQGKGYKTQYFYRAILKYKWDGFNHVILYENINYEDACIKEQELINQYNTTERSFGYNIECGGNANKEISLETRKKLSDAITGMFSGERHYNYGKHLPDSTKRKISNAHLNLKRDKITRQKISDWYKSNSEGELNHFYGKRHSDDSKKRISNANKMNKLGVNNPMFGKFGKEHHNSKQVRCITTEEIFISISDASRHYNINTSNIVACCNGKRKSAGRTKQGTKLVWEYV